MVYIITLVLNKKKIKKGSRKIFLTPSLLVFWDLFRILMLLIVNLLIACGKQIAVGINNNGYMASGNSF